MSLGSRHKIQQAGPLSISIGNTQLNSVSSQKLLGLHIDETLSWTQHIDYLCSVVSSRISLLRQLSYYVPENIQKIYSSHDRLRFDFLGIHIKNEHRKNKQTAKKSGTYHLKNRLYYSISLNVSKTRMDGSITTYKL